MTEPQEEPQKFMIKLPPRLHRQLMAYAGVKGEALSDILVKWASEVWAQQPEHKAIVAMVDNATPKTPAEKKTGGAKSEKSGSTVLSGKKSKNKSKT